MLMKCELFFFILDTRGDLYTTYVVGIYEEFLG